MKSRFITILSFLILCLPLTDLVAKQTDDLAIELAALTDRVTALETDLTTAQTNLAAAQAALAAHAADAAAHHTKYTNAEASAAAVAAVDISDLESAIASYDDPLDGVTRFDDDPLTDNTDTIRFTGMNVQVVNGSGTTNGTPDGTGNLIIGYNESRSWAGDNDRTGSHMLVIGSENNYSSYGGMVVGYHNETSGGFSTVSGGSGNTASAAVSTVSGGAGKLAISPTCTVAGGYYSLLS